MIRRHWKISLAMTVIAVLFLAAYSARYRAIHKLERYKAELRQKGEKLTIPELMPISHGDPNGGPQLLSALGQVGGWSYNIMPPLMRMVKPGVAMASWQQRELFQTFSRSETNLWPALNEVIFENRVSLAAMQRAVQQTNFEFAVAYLQGFRLLLPHIAKVKGASALLATAAIVELHDGNSQSAFKQLKASVELPTRFNEPLLISQLIRISMMHIAALATWEALQGNDWSEAQWRELQNSWEQVQFLDGVDNALQMERGMALDTFAEVKRSPDLLFSLSNNSSGPSGELEEFARAAVDHPMHAFRRAGRRFLGYWWWRWCWSYDDERASISYFQCGREAAATLKELNSLNAAFDVLRAPQARAGMNEWVGNDDMHYVLTSMHAASLDKALSRVATAQSVKQLVCTAIALKRYSMKYGTYPETLATLVPEFLSSIPTDFTDGKPLRYKLQDNGNYLLYSVGEDGKDDGGDPSMPEKNARLSFLKARDMVWPRPATPQELSQFEEKERKRLSAPASILIPDTPSRSERLLKAVGISTNR